MTILPTLTHAALRPTARAWLSSARTEWRHIPRPTDDPVVTLPGTEPLRVVLLGDDLAMGYGVVSHDLAIPGHLARQLRTVTGRGVSVHVISDESVTAQTAADRFTGPDASTTDVVVVMLGLTEAVRLPPMRRWRSSVHALLRRINEHTRCGAQVLLVGIPPVTAMPVLTGFGAWSARRQVPELNRELATASSGYPNVHFLPFSPPAEPNPDRYRSSATYREWAEPIGAAVAQLVQRRLAGGVAVVDPRQRPTLVVPDRVIGPMAGLYAKVGMAPPWERVVDETGRDLTTQPPERWPWPWNPFGALPSSLERADVS